MTMIKKNFCSSNSDVIKLGDAVYKLIKSLGYDCQDNIVSLERLNHFIDGIVKDKKNKDLCKKPNKEDSFHICNTCVCNTCDNRCKLCGNHK